MYQAPKNQPFVMAKTARVLPPGGGFASFFELLGSYKSKGNDSILTKFKEKLGNYFFDESSEGSRVYLSCSGKAALFKLLENLDRKNSKEEKIAALSSYTCPDIASTLIKAGYKLVLFDLKIETFEPDYESISLPKNKKLDLLILSNLYGLPNSLPPLSIINKLCNENYIIVDDACQAGLSLISGKRVGSRGDFGLLSFGRGKFIPGMGGGAFMVNNEKVPSLKNETLKQSLPSFLLELLKSQILWLFQFPVFYKFLSSIKSLKLGETTYNKDFEVKNIRSSDAFVAYSQLLNISKRDEIYKINSSLWLKELSVFNELSLPASKYNLNEVIPIRFPVILKGNRDLRDKILKELKIFGLGATASYPALLEDYKEITSKILTSSSKNSRIISNKILTLPLHRFLKEKDIVKTVEIFKKHIS